MHISECAPLSTEHSLGLLVCRLKTFQTSTGLPEGQNMLIFDLLIFLS